MQILVHKTTDQRSLWQILVHKTTDQRRLWQILVHKTNRSEEVVADFRCRNANTVEAVVDSTTNKNSSRVGWAGLHHQQ